MRPALTLTLALLDVAGCAEPAPATSRGADLLAQASVPATADLPLARGGQRLRAMYFVSSGVEMFRHFVDTALEIACEWAPTAELGVRCIPKARASLVYADAQCSQPAVELAPEYFTHGIPHADPLSPRAPKEGDWVSASEGDRPATCAGPLPPARKIYRVGEKLFDAADRERTIYFVGGDGSCRRSSVRPYAVHRLQPADVSQLAAGSLTAVDVGDGLAVRRVVAEDGSEFSLGLQRADGEPCALIEEGLCVSRHFERITHAGIYYKYAEPTCEGPRLFVSTQTKVCGAPTVGVEADGRDAKVYPLTPAVSAFERIQRVVDNKFVYPCEPSPPEDARWRSLFVRGPEMTASVPKARRARLGQGPLYRELFVAPTTDRVVPLEQGDRFMDATGERCSVMPAVDGSYRCLPDHSDLSEVGLWRDPMCREPLYLLRYRSPGAPEPHNAVMIPRPPGTYPAVITGLASVEPYAGPLYTQRSEAGSPTRCASIGDTSSPTVADLSLGVPGQPLPLSVLEEVKEQAR